MLKDSEPSARQSFLSLSMAALGIVYGDIGTSPLYAMRVTLEGLSINLMDVLGILSLIFWSLTLLISVKYLFLLFRADNDGEGGILALLALIKPPQGEHAQLFLIIGILGAGLMLGDGMLTPAISVISAVEGVNMIIPSLSHWVIPMTCGILIALFSMQHLGTAKIGIVFGPILLIWFVVIGALGIVQVAHNPVVLHAINPMYAVRFIEQMGFKGYILLGGIFLVVTGGEALYADLGHFGKAPIRFSWFMLALPGLLCNYFGQGAYLLDHPEAIANPFYCLAPDWFEFPLLVLATAATIIASQAVISATFSLTKQAILLGFYPHLPIIQTSGFQRGQIYIPQMNFVLALGTLLLILVFKNSDAMTHAYGIAVNLVMLLTLLLVVQVAIHQWHWGWLRVLGVLLFFGTIDLAFLGANMLKILTGGWLPIVFASFAGLVMYTWSKGRRYLKQTYYMQKDELSIIFTQLDQDGLTRLPRMTAIFITDIYDKSGGSFLHFLKLSQLLPENILLLSYCVDNIPHVSSLERFETHCIRNNVCELTLHYGFMDIISIPQALYVANDRGLLPFSVDIETAMYFIEIPNVLASKQKKGLGFFWQDKLFSFLVRNYSANLNIEFYQLPYNRTIAMGTYYLI
jgi:KUP system potassium uptake protein